MTREEKIQAFAMYLDGSTFEEIGNGFGVTGSYIRKILFAGRGRGKHKFKCIYPGLARWMNEHRYTVTKLARELDLSISRPSVAKKLSGVSTFTFEEIRAILLLTGLSFEEAFEEEHIPGGEPNGCEQQAEGREI